MDLSCRCVKNASSVLDIFDQLTERLVNFKYAFCYTINFRFGSAENGNDRYFGKAETASVKNIVTQISSF